MTYLIFSLIMLLSLITRLPFAVLAIALIIVICDTGLVTSEFVSQRFIFLFLSLMTIPLCAYLCASALAKYFKILENQKTIVLLAGLAGFFMLLQDDYIFKVLALINESSNTVYSIKILQVLNSAVFAVALVTFVITAFVALIELVLGWCFRARQQMTKLIPAFRPAIIILLVTFLLDRIGEFFVKTLI